MTRKDYEAIAAALTAARCVNYSGEPADKLHNQGCETAARYIADVMARDNPRFDRGRFLKAAGVAQ